jgi:hypothetical protein
LACKARQKLALPRSRGSEKATRFRKSRDAAVVITKLKNEPRKKGRGRQGRARGRGSKPTSSPCRRECAAAGLACSARSQRGLSCRARCFASARAPARRRSRETLRLQCDRPPRRRAGRAARPRSRSAPSTFPAAKIERTNSRIGPVGDDPLTSSSAPRTEIWLFRGISERPGRAATFSTDLGIRPLGRVAQRGSAMPGDQGSLQCMESSTYCLTAERRWEAPLGRNLAPRRLTHQIGDPSQGWP